jgi:hypothetical protein
MTQHPKTLVKIQTVTYTVRKRRKMKAMERTPKHL